ncbi:MAG: amino acid permease [Bacteroidota bacterium]
MQQPDGQIGLLPATALVVGNMIGSGIFLLPAALGAYGGISILGWVCSSLGAILLATVFSKLSQLQPGATGGPYAYTREGLGEFPAFLVAWGYWISIWSTNAAIAVALVGYLGVFFPALLSNNLLAIFTGLGFIWGVSWINTLSVKTVGWVQLITTILKVMPILFIGLIGIFYFQVEHFVPFNLSGESNWSAITNTTMLTLFAYLGMESATIASGSIAASEQTVSRATLLGTGLTILLYILSSVAVLGIVPPDVLQNSTSPFADAAALFWGKSARYIVAGGAVIATMGALNGWILLQGQLPMAAAKDGLFPKLFGQVNQRKMPVRSILLSSILVSVLMLLNYTKSLVGAFTFMMTLSTLSVITPYIFSTASLAIFLKKRKDPAASRYLLVAFLAFLFSLWIIVGCGMEVVFWGFLLLMLGIPFYVGLKTSS